MFFLFFYIFDKLQVLGTQKSQSPYYFVEFSYSLVCLQIYKHRFKLATFPQQPKFIQIQKPLIMNTLALAWKDCLRWLSMLLLACAYKGEEGVRGIIL